jgi:hypothetical protein
VSIKENGLKYTIQSNSFNGRGNEGKKTTYSWRSPHFSRKSASSRNRGEFEKLNFCYHFFSQHTPNPTAQKREKPDERERKRERERRGTL